MMSYINAIQHLDGFITFFFIDLISYQERLIEQISKPLCEVLDETVRVPQYVQPQYEDIGLLYSLVGVVRLDLIC